MRYFSDFLRFSVVGIWSDRDKRRLEVITMGVGGLGFSGICSKLVHSEQGIAPNFL